MRTMVKPLIHQQDRFLEDDLMNSPGWLNSTSETQTRLLEILVSKVSDDRSFDFSQQLLSINNLFLMVQAEPIPARLKPINLETRGGSNSRSDGSDQRVEAIPVDMTKVQRMIDSAMKKGSKLPKFIHPYPS
ncbi:hypothetical protein ACFX16_030857 [Malus domestica]